MILNYKAAIEMLIEHAEETGFNTFTFFNLHALLSENLLPDANASGRLRTTSVEIGGTVFHPLAVPQQIDDCFRLIYELNRVELLRDVFVWAYERSCQRYVAVKESTA